MGVRPKALQDADPRVGNDELETLWCRVEHEVSAIFMLAVLQNVRVELAYRGDKLTGRVVCETTLYGGAFRAHREICPIGIVGLDRVDRYEALPASGVKPLAAVCQPTEQRRVAPRVQPVRRMLNQPSLLQLDERPEIFRCDAWKIGRIESLRLDAESDVIH